MKHLHEVIRRPIITEKGLQIKELQRTLVFEVAMEATKPEIKRAVETVFNVKVADAAGKTLAVSSGDSIAGGCSDGTLDSLGRRALFADISFGVALGAAVATAVLYLRSDSSSVTVAPAEGGATVGYATIF